MTARRHISRAITVLTPILFSLFTPLSLYANNLGEIRLQSIYRALFLAAALAALLTAVACLLLRSTRRGAALSAVFLLLFFSYGHIYSRVRTFQIGGVLLGRHRSLLILWMVLAILAAWLIVVRIRDKERLAHFFTISGSMLLLIPLISILMYHIRDFSFSPTSDHGRSTSSNGLTVFGDMPDVYYIMVDEYARWDVLAERYGYDNSAFKDFLEARHFTIAEQSRSNYPTTKHSIASSLNMDFIDAIVPEREPGTEVEFSDVLTGLIQQNQVMQYFDQLGYKQVGFATGYIATEFFDADYVFTPEMGGMDKASVAFSLNGYESMLIEQSILKVLLDFEALQGTTAYEYIWARMQTPFAVQRDIILAAFENLKLTTTLVEPKFVFIHLLSPHPPYKFGPEGEPLYHQEAFTLLDDSVGDTWKYYTDELRYLTTRLEETIDYILTHAQRPVVIVLQSDHGATPNWRYDQQTEQMVLDRISILNAYYMTEACQAALYPAITPVNSFRVLFNCYFGGQFQMLPDQTYFGFDEFISVEAYMEGLKTRSGSD